jgi:hypothetical protein
MRKYSKKLMLVAAVVIMLNFNSCSTYDEGPSFSLRTKTARLTGEWKIDKVDGTRVNQDVYLEFEDDGDFEVTYQYSYYGYSYTYRMVANGNGKTVKNPLNWIMMMDTKMNGKSSS